MDANEYQQLAGRTLIAAPDATYTAHELMLAWNALGLAGEAGEVADLIKKSVFHRHELDREKLIGELGDVLWYVAALATKLGVRLSDVMEGNVAKLTRRYPAGYSSAASVARADVAVPPCARCGGAVDNLAGAFLVAGASGPVCRACALGERVIAQQR